jgi:hypothetical protein
MILSASQLQSVLRQAGWPESLIVTMTAIGLAESSGNTTALNARGEHSVGLFQINMNAHGTRFGTQAQLYDPLTNARAALTLYNERQREGKRNGLTHWGAFTDGRYRQYLSASQAAYNAISGAAGAASNFVNNATGAAANFMDDDQALGGMAGIFLLGLGLIILLRR